MAFKLLSRPQEASKKKKAELSNQHAIRALKKENKILRSEIRRLSRLLKTNMPADNTAHYDTVMGKMWSAKEKETRAFSSGNYIKYVWSKVTGGSIYSLWKKVMGYFRKFRLVSTIMRVISSILTVIGTGAFFIFVSGAVVFIIPFVLTFSAAVYFFGTVSRAKAMNELHRKLHGKNIYVFFPKKGRPFERGSSFRQTVDLIANGQSGDNFVVIVSPYLFSAVGFGGDGVKFYPVLRYEQENVCIIRNHSFFTLRKKILEPAEKRTSYIY